MGSSYREKVANYQESLFIPANYPLVRYFPEMANRKYNQKVHRIHSRPSSRILIQTETPSYGKYSMVLQDKFN